jgi:hypothetical protein
MASSQSIIAPDVWAGKTLRKDMLDGKWIGYSSETVFFVQTGKGPKGAYTSSCVAIKGSLYRAINYYNGINIGLGYKKRVVMAGKVLAKAKS